MKVFFFSILSLLAFAGCGKEATGSDLCFDGVIRWEGEPAADGLGWTIHKEDGTNSKPFIPRNLPNNFKVNNLEVHVCMYKTGEKFHCHCVQPLDKYHITSIRRR